MNIQPQPKIPYKIKAEFVGPIMSLDSELSFKDQNLIFATNGTGKSFLARAFRMLDDNAFESADHETIAESIVSEEANIKNGVGSFSFSKGTEVNGALSLNTKLKTTTRSDVNFLYHVFSTDYIEAELKSRQYELDGNIENEIIIGKENADLDAKIEEEKTEKDSIKLLWQELNTKFNLAKESLKANFSINAQLGAYKNILSGYWTGNEFNSDPNASLGGVQQEYDQYKTFPTEPIIPVVADCDTIFYNVHDLSETLVEVVSISSVSQLVKEKIQKNQHFYSHGLSEHLKDKEHCPFCTQTMNETAFSAIDTYTQYFADEEAKAIQKLKGSESLIKQKIEAIEDYRTNLLERIIQYDELKKYFSDQKTNELFNSSSELEALVIAYTNLLSEIALKMADLATPIEISEITNVEKLEVKIRAHNLGNTDLCKKLKSAVDNLDGERKNIQRRACATFKSQFYNDNDSLAQTILTSEKKIALLNNEVVVLQKKFGQKVAARSKVAETFSVLLEIVFGEKYSFDETDFTVKRNKGDMTRGGDRTLSDGEKSVLAFCYFIAQSHLRVETVDCYKKLFFVIDDPVSSLSFDYIYSIAQILKGLQIDGGEISLQQIPNPRPRLLILTHNDYLYNIAINNNIVHRSSIFQLIAESNTKHKLVSLKTFLTPHTLHLKHVQEVSEGKTQLDHSTPNSIRSVIESMWRFCRPDCGDLAAFIGVANNEVGVTTKSLLINDLSHGGKFVSNPPVYTDVKTAADETIAIVNHFASGQIKSIST